MSANGIGSAANRASASPGDRVSGNGSRMNVAVGRADNVLTVTFNPVRIRPMTATLIDGKAVSQQVRAEVRDEIAAWVSGGGRRPGLATVLVGEDPASAVYVGNKQKACAEVGIEGFAHDLPADSTQEQVVELLAELNADERVSGILLQLPTPPHIDGSHLTTLIDPAKDVDGLTPVSAGLLAKGLPGLRPCTPAGVIELLKRYDVPSRAPRR